MRDQTRTLAAKKRHTLLAIALAAMFVSYLFATQSTRSDYPDHGNWSIDMEQTIAARAFASFGFSSLDFGATRDNGPEVSLAPYYYTHYSPFPAIALGYLYSLGLTITQAHILPLLVSGSALLAIYLLARRVLGDWRAGVVAVLALASSAPFHLLADSFANPAYDFAAKTWTMLFTTLGCLAEGKRRWAWFAGSGIGALATVSLSGIEMAPAIAAYAVLFPAFSTTGSRRQGCGRLAALSGLWIGAGLLGGMLLWLIHNAILLGSLNVALTDFANMIAYYFRPVIDSPWGDQNYAKFPQDDTVDYVSMLVYRAVGYFPIHLVGIALALSIGGIMASALHRDWDWRPYKWLGILFVSELLWLLIFRGHTAVNAYTIYQLSLSISLATAITLTMAWRVAGTSASGRYLAALAGAALFAASLAYLGVQPRGNLQVQVDLSEKKQQFEAFASPIPVNGVVLFDIGETDPSPQFFIDRTFVRREWLNRLDNAGTRPWFLLTRPNIYDEGYKQALSTNLLLKKTTDYALFDMNSSQSRTSSKTEGAGNPGQGGLQR
ncbi:MAG: hypothetical protein HYX94_08980 [Chloroflexi bacterium]|nr:hypothetical protein [Chloroflexota bacterium]